MIDTQKLRQRLLDLAIRGKLVAQDPNDEPASVLLERIRAEKERLIAEGKIKRPKSSTKGRSHSENAKTSSSESHYQKLPNGWIECRIEEIAKTLTDFVASGSFASLRENVQYYDSPNYAILVRTKDFGNNFKNGLVYTDKHGYDFLNNSNLYGGELILPNIGASIGKVFVMPTLNIPMTLAPNSIMIRCWEKPILKWLYILFQSTLGQNILASISASTAQGKFNKTDLREVKIPLPPIEEQKRILDYVDSLLGYVENINNSKTALIESLNSTKSKILELAMQGKLVSQDPADEPAADMLHRINPKARIITDNPHYPNMPAGWCLSTVKDLCVFLSRGKSPKYADSPNQYPVFAQKCNLKDGGVSLGQARFLDETTLDKWPEKYRLRTGDVLINSTGTGTVGRTRLFDESVLRDYPFTVPDSHVSVIRSYDEINSTYLFYYLISSTIQEYFEDNLAGSTNQKELYIDVIGNTEVLLPPLKEQNRIVAKVTELFSILQKLESNLMN